GPRRPRPFVPVNSAALSEALLESQLFGHARGAFSGADRARPGLLAEAEVCRGRFRADLYYRLRVICLRVPPLRERMEDLPALAAHFLAAAAQGQAKELDPEALDRLLSHPWPGNVRELENEMRRVSLLSGPVVRPADLSPELSRATPRARLGDSRRAWEREALRSALEAAGGNKSEAARRLGYSRFGLRKKLRRVGLV
ncbi:MAG: sigma 54-interacting transcriptional regulator, partial [Planctomycetes bacterium]|nr:sigma 54-interacting transcriptional regulator [Planctomycetota bacterium]